MNDEHDYHRVIKKENKIRVIEDGIDDGIE